MVHQLHMMRSTKDILIERHDFYVAETKKRVLTNFENVEQEATQGADAEYARLMSLPARDDVDPADIAEQATDFGQNLYMLLDDLREQTILGALAGCFHQWDKDLRDFFERELRHTANAKEVAKIAWGPDWKVLFDVLKAFGWDVRTAAFFRYLDAGRLIVNVHKHGNGRSLKELAEKYPEYIRDPIPEVTFSQEYLDHDWVKISVAQFDEIAEKGIRQFWLDFPELMTLK